LSEDPKSPILHFPPTEVRWAAVFRGRVSQPHSRVSVCDSGLSQVARHLQKTLTFAEYGDVGPAGTALAFPEITIDSFLRIRDCTMTSLTWFSGSTPRYATVPAFEIGGRELGTVSRFNGSALYAVAKRTTDLLGAGFLLILLMPLFAAIALTIKLTSRGPIFFSQWRVGEGGRRFRFYKFRSMVVDAEERKAALLAWNDHQDSITFKMKRDPRITLIGRWIRKGSIDELPQLWNVLKGDMSLVGPRPPVPSEVALYTEEEWQRLTVTPGLTCLWQVSGRGDLPFDRQVELDREYIRRRSWWFDCVLLLRTIPAVLTARGAY
jgi:lipopolysaccharide/colanic/teichoic acid biosynthesis glycosyltransferase